MEKQMVGLIAAVHIHIVEWLSLFSCMPYSEYIQNTVI